MAIKLFAAGDALANSLGSTFAVSTTSFSISAWIAAPWNGQAGASSYLGLYNSLGGAGAIQIGSRTAANTCSIWTWGGAVILTSTPVLVSGAWAHLVYTFDGTTARLYIDGTLNTSAAYAPAVSNLNQVFVNGYPTGISGESANFEVDTYNLYNRVLSPAEILTMATSRGNRHGILTGNILRYEFDEGAVGSNVSQVLNQSTQIGATSNSLVSNSARIPRAVFSASQVSNNLRTPV